MLLLYTQVKVAVTAAGHAAVLAFYERQVAEAAAAAAAAAVAATASSGAMLSLASPSETATSATAAATATSAAAQTAAAAVRRRGIKVKSRAGLQEFLAAVEDMLVKGCPDARAFRQVSSLYTTSYLNTVCLSLEAYDTLE
jgi:hypothetical protein